MQDLNNYRPISLLPVSSKIFERSLYGSMFKFFTEDNLISQNQSGFKPGDSCTNQLLSITSLLNYVPCVLKTCSRANVPCVLTCLRAHVPTCQRALRAYVLKYQRALRVYVLTCQRALRNHVPTCFAGSRANVLVLMSLFSVSLPLLLKLHTLLIRFKILITAFPQ